MESCAFCRIARGEVQAKVLFADDDVVAFEDVWPQAPVHVLIIPRRHISSIAEGTTDDTTLFGRLLHAAAEAARRTGIAASGYRVVTNSGSAGGQSIFHLHLHVLGGRQLGWPPG